MAQAEHANPLYRAYLDDFETFEPVQRQDDAGQRDPDRQSRSASSAPSARCSSSTASSSRPASRSWPTRRRGPTAPACSTARTPAWPWRPCASSSSARSSARTSASSSSPRRTGSSSPSRRRPTTWGQLEGIKPTHRNRPRRDCRRPRARSRDAIARHVEQGASLLVVVMAAPVDRAPRRRSRCGPSTRAVHGGEPRPKPANALTDADHPDGDLHLRRHRRSSKDHFEGRDRARRVRPLRQPHPARRGGASWPRWRAPRTACSSRAAWRR